MNEKPKVISINPGNLSTHVALFEGDRILKEKKIYHSQKELNRFSYKVIEQIGFRTAVINEMLDEWEVEKSSIHAVIGRGGLFRPLESGTYMVNDRMINDIKAGRMLGEHISNIGAILAKDIAEKFGVPAFIADPVSVDEFEDIARVSGIPEIKRDALQHTLNMKYTARLAAAEMNKNVEELQLVIAHLGSGISVCPMNNGRLIDANNAIQEGPFSPRRSGGLPTNHLVDLCFSGKYDKEWIKKRLVGNGGLVAYTGTSDMREIEERIKSNDSKAKFYLEAMAYQVSKEIGAMATVLKGKVDAIILTGGCAYSEILNEIIVDSIKYIAPIKIYPGEHEMLALVEAVLKVLEGEEKIKSYPY